MSYTVSAAYHEHIRDGKSKQNFILVDRDSPFNILSASDGDFVAGTPMVRRSVCESTDFTLGECPSASLSVTLSNPYGDANDFWNKRGIETTDKNVWVQAAIGVQTGKYTSSSPNIVLHLFAEDNPVYVRDGELIINDTENITIVDGELIIGPGADYVSIIDGELIISDANDVIVTIGRDTITISIGDSGFVLSESGWDLICASAVYTSGSTATIYVGQADKSILKFDVQSNMSSVPSVSTVSLSSIPGSIARKLTTPNRAVIYNQNRYPSVIKTFKNGTWTEETWEYCPIGVYLMKPPKYSLRSTIIDVVDAMDAMCVLDTNLRDLAAANNISLDTNAAELVNAMCEALRVPAETYTTISPVPITEEMITADITCRQLLRWIGERAGHLWLVDPVGILRTYVPPTFIGVNTNYTLTDSDLASGYDIYNEFVDPPEKLIIYYGEDSTYVSQAATLTREDYYKISGNPLYMDPASDVLPWLTYNTIPIRSYQIAECVALAADVSYGYGDCMYISSMSDYQTYIMQETITFGVRAIAEYRSTGSDTRIDTTADTYTRMVVDQVSGRVDELPGIIGEETDGKISQALEDALAAGGIIESAISQATEDLISKTDIYDQLNDIRAEIVNADTIRQWITDAVNAFSSELKQYLSWSDQTGLAIKAVDENGQPAPTYLNLMNDLLAFMYGNNMPAWMTSDKFNINNLMVQISASIVGLIIQKVTVGGIDYLRIS